MCGTQPVAKPRASASRALATSWSIDVRSPDASPMNTPTRIAAASQPGTAGGEAFGRHGRRGGTFWCSIAAASDASMSVRHVR